MTKKYSRRSALLGAAAGACSISPFQVLLTNMMSGMLNKAYALDAGIDPRSYIYIFLRGGPQRWVWDPISAFDDPSRMITNPGLATKFLVDGSGNYMSGEYATTLQKGANMPWMWQSQLPTSAGTTVPMNNLMDSMLVMLGVNINNPAHTGAAAAGYYPLGIPYSLTSLTADKSKAPIPHVSINGYADMFKSELGKTGIYTYAGGSALNNLLSPYNLSQTSSFQLEKNKIDMELKKVASGFFDYAKKGHPGASSLLPNKKGAQELMIQSFGDLNASYATLYTKYRALIDTVTDPYTFGLIGISDKQIGVDTIIRDSVRTANLNSMAGRFAMTEFLIIKKLTQSITFGGDNFSQPDPTMIRFTHDSHSEDVLTNTAQVTFFNLAIAVCINELKDRLIDAGMYNDTLIQINGEFNRNPKANGSGNDHGYKNSSVTFFSGAIKKFDAIGNTAIDSGTTRYPGSYGMMADNPGYGKLNLGHVAASVGTMLRTKSPVTATPSLVKEDAGVITSKLPSSKLVA